MHGPDATSVPAPLDAHATRVALETGATIRWWQTTAFLEVAGPDAASFLDGLCTQAVERVSEGTAVLGLFLDAKAKIVAPVVLHHVGDCAWTDPRTESALDAPRLLLETLPELVEPLRAHLARFRLRSRVTLEPRPDIATIAIVGAGAASAVEQLPDTVEGSWTQVAEQARPTHTFMGDTDPCSRLVRELLPAAGLGLADPDTLEADRIEHAVAGLHDLLPGRMPAEVGGMDAAVALDAGCYLGQEPVARLHYRGHANRSLRRLAGEAALSVTPGEGDAPFELRPEGADPQSRAVGRLTTWAHHPDGGTVALAMLRREVAAGTGLVLSESAGILRPIDAPAE